MKISKGKDKIIFLSGFILAVVLIILINIFITKANYRKAENIPLAKGTINYTLVDFEIVEITIDGQPSEKMPTGNYELTSESYCTEKNEQFQDITNSNIKLTYQDNILSVSNYTKKGTKCHLYFKSKPKTFNINKTGTSVGNVTILYNGNSYSNNTLSVEKGDNLSLEFTNNGDYYVSSISDCSYTGEVKNSDGISIKNVQIENITEDITCTINFQKRYIWMEYELGTIKVCTKNTTKMAQSCGAGGRWTTVSGYSDDQCQKSYSKTGYVNCGLVIGFEDTITYYTLTETKGYIKTNNYKYSFESGKYGTSTSETNPSPCDNKYCVKQN